MPDSMFSQEAFLSFIPASERNLTQCLVILIIALQESIILECIVFLSMTVLMFIVLL